MEDQQAAVDLLSSLSDTVSIDYGVLTAIAWPADAVINSTTPNNNCTHRYKNGCSPREKLHFRFWPANVNGSAQTSQGIMALVVLLILLCLVITYCCWGTCCKLIRKNRLRRRNTSFDSCASDPRLMMVWSPTAAMTLQQPPVASELSLQEQHRPHRLVKPRVRELPPPPYESLFGTDTLCMPPTYSSLALSGNPQDVPSSSSSNPAVVAVVIDGETETANPPRDVHQYSGRFLRSQSVPSSIGSSSQITHIAVLFRTENREI